MSSRPLLLLLGLSRAPAQLSSLRLFRWLISTWAATTASAVRILSNRPVTEYDVCIPGLSGLLIV